MQKAYINADWSAPKAKVPIITSNGKMLPGKYKSNIIDTK